MSEQQIFNGNLALKKTPRVVVIPPNETVRGRKLRVAAYVRVSSNSSDQLNSYAAQNAHYTELITSNSDWDFVDVYADKGITGTSAEKRDDFQRLLQDCRRGRIDLVLTKSSSRFARNTKESLEAARELKALGYDGQRPWNKNMVARILENRKYLGEDGYPQIIPAELFEKVQRRRQSQIPSSQKTPGQKALKCLCGGMPPAYVEAQVRNILNHLIRCPEEVTCGKTMKDSQEVRGLRRELETLLQDPPVDEERAKELTFEIATIQLNGVGPEEYETERLQRLFQRRQPMAELDAELLHESVRKITYSGDKTTVLLKNNQSFEGGRTNERK